ncbi:hypothetical protein DH2020_039729 [Rehmannia glutinosa]|uniref:Lipid droplet-associated hydrolase n=1 Tax=Rehmannia glutinosa TaxID=99300 RepID=A0ABR0UX68_REHGL
MSYWEGLLLSQASIGHIAHSEKDWESGRLFSLQEQISHKRSFIEQELEDVQVPIVLLLLGHHGYVGAWKVEHSDLEPRDMPQAIQSRNRKLKERKDNTMHEIDAKLLNVGHSIGAYISLEIFRRYHEKVIYCIGLYPFLALNAESSTQSSIKGLAASSALCAAVSSMGALLGMLPVYISRFLVKESMGFFGSVLIKLSIQYHTIRNILFMAMTEFQEMPEKPDWDFLRRKKSQVAFLFGLDDHWGPMHLYEEIRKQVPEASVEVEREGHTHAFSCTEAGSLWVAQHVSSLIKNNIENAKSI